MLIKILFEFTHVSIQVGGGGGRLITDVFLVYRYTGLRLGGLKAVVYNMDQRTFSAYE